MDVALPVIGLAALPHPEIRQDNLPDECIA